MDKTIAELIEKFLHYLNNNQECSDNTITAYRRDILGLNKYLVGQKIFYAREVTSSHLRAYVGLLPTSANSKARTQTAIRSFFRYLYEEDIVRESPANKLSRIKIKQKPTSWLTQEQFDKLIETVGFASPYYKERDLALVNIMAKSGLRRAEISSLNVEDVDFERNRITVKRKGGDIVEVIIHHELSDDIKRYLDSIDRADTEPLFLSRLNRRIDASSIWHIIKKYARRAGLGKNVTVHSLRHTFATRLAERGMKPTSIQHLMGHKSLTTTSRYLHIKARDVEKEFNDISFKEEVLV